MKKMILLLAMAAALCLYVFPAIGESYVSLNIRASRSVTDSVIYAGEDVDITATVDGITAAGYIWYKDGILLEDQITTVLHISDADTDDSGVYTVDVVGENGRVIVSIEALLRVVDRNLPQTGDTRMPIQTVYAVLTLSCLISALLLKHCCRNRGLT